MWRSLGASRQDDAAARDRATDDRAAAASGLRSGHVSISSERGRHGGDLSQPPRNSIRSRSKEHAMTLADTKQPKDQAASPTPTKAHGPTVFVDGESGTTGPRQSANASTSRATCGQKHRAGKAQGCGGQARADGGGRPRHPLPAGRCGRARDRRADRQHGRRGPQGARCLHGASGRAATGSTVSRNSRRIRPTRSGRRGKVSNPGCYPTGAIALIRPLVDAGLMPADYPVTINAVSGYSGGGKSMIAEVSRAARRRPSSSTASASSTSTCRRRSFTPG